MGWRQFQAQAPVECMEKMESIAAPVPLISLTPFIPPVGTAGTGGALAPPVSSIDWRPPFKAWLAADGGFRTIGVSDDLAGEIIRLTADNLPLQAKLLRETVGSYLPGPHWQATLHKFDERTRVLFEVQGLPLREAKRQAADEYKLLAFSDELNIELPGIPAQED